MNQCPKCKKLFLTKIRLDVHVGSCNFDPDDQPSIPRWICQECSQEVNLPIPKDRNKYYSTNHEPKFHKHCGGELVIEGL